MKYLLFFTMLIFSLNLHSQTDIEKVLKGGEILINGLSFFKNSNSISKSTNSKIIEIVCIKNKLTDKIIFSLIGLDSEGNQIKKELIIQKDGKECVFELPKGIYTYEILLVNKETFKKGEYKFNEEITITVKEEG